MKTLAEKVAFVTGGTRGMGEAIVRRLASEGASVAFTYVSSQEKAQKLTDEITQNGGKALGIKADAAQSGALTKAINDTAEKFGKIDILVNNAAIAVAGPLDQAAERSGDYDRQVDVNIRAVSEAVRAAVKYIPEGGRVINIGSVGGKRIGGPFMSDYAATKAAISGYTRGLAWDLAPRNITVNTVEPGAIDTDMMPTDPAVREAFTNAIPLKRLGKPQEIAAMVNFLAGPEASYITGSSFTVDGGINA
ncbi:SDR family NAD(P)-dependent oxidoreductase [Dyadobacter fermentans]|uniref:Short-chain dehydrogenase/reductase SDR n=1 Tax=Dyadobacter fermentans (strain ATCC 700827 / DSM 18053 / CIP 107007 / KCTC 52180 / NS114) TaxID=471854 RepID=C6VZS4_DYAFD|nr:3-oxoacyl-ACP reductase family protein [Dyadobacter fermentans]ACT93552.1 short-chain dehydrogenase/reductase SDR [Dyadobacter fermentans DSM 18053]